MNRLIDVVSGVPAAVLAHPWLTLAGVVVAGAGYLALLKIVWRHEDRQDARRAKRHYGTGEGS